jgi:hypothetical protein
MSEELEIDELDCDDDFDDAGDRSDGEEESQAIEVDADTDFDSDDEHNPVCFDCRYSSTLRCPHCGRLTERALSKGALAFDDFVDPEYPYEMDDEDEYDFLFGDGFQIYDGDDCPTE